MRANHLEHRRNLALGKAETTEHTGSALDRVCNVIPFRELFQVLRPVPIKNAKVVDPSGGEQNIVIINLAFADASSERVKPRLVAKLIDGTCLLADIFRNRSSKALCVGHLATA